MNHSPSACLKEDLLEGLDEDNRAELLKRFVKLDTDKQDEFTSNAKLNDTITTIAPSARFQALRFLMQQGALDLFGSKGYSPDPLIGKIAFYLQSDRNALPLPRLVRKLRFYLVKHGPLHMQGFVERFSLDHLLRAFTSRVLHTLFLDESLAFNIPLMIDPRESKEAWSEAFRGRIRKCWLLSYVDSPQRARPSTEGLNLSAQFNRFTDLNYRALYYLNLQDKTVGTCLNCLIALEDMLRCYLGLFHDANFSASLDELKRNFAEADIFLIARDQIERSVRQELNLSDDSPLELDTSLPTHTESIMMAYDGEKTNRLIHSELHGLNLLEKSNISIAELINILHQKGLARGVRIFDSLRQAGGRVITEISSEREESEHLSDENSSIRTNDFITFIDLRQSRQGGSVPFPVRVIVDAVTRNANIIPDSSRLKTVLYVSELESHLDVKIGGHSARIHYSLAPPERGGRFGLQYAEGGNEEGNQRRLEVMARAFRKGGLKVSVSGQLLEAIYDKDCGATTMDSVREKTAIVLQILASMPDLDYALAGFNGSFTDPQHVDLFGYFDKQAMDQLLESWAQHCFENGFFFLHLLRPAKNGEDQFYHKPELYWDGRGPYTDPYLQKMHQCRGMLEGALRESLKRVMLPFFDGMGLGSFPIGQSLFDRLIDKENRALRHSLLTLNARGYVCDNPAVRELRQHPVTLFLEYLKDDAILPVLSQIAQLAEQVSNLGSWEDLGKLGGLWVSRLRISLIKDVLSFFVLKVPENRQILAAFATIGEDPIPVPFIDRVGERIRPSNIITSADWIVLILNVFGYRVEANAECALLNWEEIKPYLMKPNPPDSDLGLSSIPGVVTSPGVVTGRFRANAPERSPVDFRDGILVDHYLTPSDDARIQTARGVLITSGGELSHAAIRTREFRKPSIILKDISYQDGTIEYSPHYNQCSMTCYPLPLRYITVHACYCVPGNQSVIKIREGDIMRLDAEQGKLILLGSQEGIQRNFEAILMLERQPRLDAVWMDLGRELESTPDLDVFLFLLSELILVQELPTGTLEPLLEAARSNSTHGRELEDYLRHIYLDFATRTDSLLLKDKLRIIRSGSLMEVCYYLGETVSRCERLKNLENLLGIDVGDGASTRDRMSGILELVFERIERQRPRILEELTSALERVRQQEEADSQQLMLCKRLLRRARDANLENAPVFPDLAESVKDQQQRKAQKAQAINTCGDGECYLVPKNLLDSDFRSFVGGKASLSGEILLVLGNLGEQDIYVPAGFATTTNLWRLFQQDPQGLNRTLAGALCRFFVPGLLEQLKEFGQLLSSRRLGSVMGEPAWKNLFAVLSGIQPEVSRVQEELECFCSWLTMLEIVRSDAVVLAVAQVLGRLAVRSSGIREDSMEESYAGQKLTVLNVLGPGNLFSAVLAVLNSGAEAVLIEQMIPAEISGVAFSVHPGTGNFGQILVNSAYGLGEGIVSGRVDPDTLLMDKKTGRLLGQPILGKKATRIVPSFGIDEAGETTREESLPEEWRLQLSLKDRQQQLLCSAVRTLEEHFGYPLDVEWAVDPLGRLCILQSRPITTLWDTLAKGKAYIANQTGIN